MRKIMVCGVNGFVGKHLARELKLQNCEVVGVGREAALRPELRQTVNIYASCDLTDQPSVNELPFQDIDAVINLAGLAAVGKSFDNADLYKQVNVAVLATVCSAIHEQSSSARIVAVSTGAVYDPNQNMPLLETSKLVSNGSPYAESKILMEQAAKQARSRGTECVVVRPFNHIGPGQEPGFLVPDLYEKITKAKVSKQSVKVGTLTTKRDYTDVRDVVKAYAALALADKLQYNTYNVCSSKSVSGKAVLKTLLQSIPDAGEVKIEQDPSLVRPNDPKDLYGSHEHLTEDTGWQPQIPFEQTIQDFVNSFN
jgi:GDP-4-dehydro-6-deoxy-D-mannose reductase